MSKNDWYGGYGFIPAKDNYEEMIIKKENLKRKYIKMCSLDKDLDKDLDIYKGKSKFVIEELNSKVVKDGKEDKQKITFLKKEIGNYKKDVQDLKKEISKVKKMRFEHINMINSQREEIVELKNNLLRLEALLEQERSSNRALKKDLDKHINSFDKRELKTLKYQNQKLLLSNQSLRKKLSLANKQIQNYQLIRNGEVDSVVTLKYKEQLSQKTNEADNLKQKLCLAHNVINNLNSKMANKKRSIVLRKIDEHKKTIANCSSILKSDFDENIVFGFLSLNRENKVIFIDINNKRYNISENNDSRRLRSHIGMPARAVKKDKEVLIDYIYYTVSKDTKNKSATSNKIIMSKDKLDQIIGKKDELKNKKILLVGSKRKGYYCSALARLGAEVVYHESFSDNETRLSKIAPSCDVVLVCTSHVSHSVVYEIKNMKDFDLNSIKYQMIEKDNVQNLIHRVRYVLENS